MGSNLIDRLIDRVTLQASHLSNMLLLDARYKDDLNYILYNLNQVIQRSAAKIYTPSGRIVSCGDLWRLLSLEGRVMGEWQARPWKKRAI
jgi:hypothetical protein